MGLIQLLFRDPVLFFAVAIPLLYSIIAHEVAHGFVALLFGDKTARDEGRLTFRPTPHIDPIGLIMLLFVGFGWAKPVPVNYYAFRHSRLAIASVSIAGVATNLFIAFVSLLLIQLSILNSQPMVVSLLETLARINIILGAFNLIPIPPLDGSKVLMSFLPRDTQISLARLEPYGFFILIIFIMTGMLNPVINFMQQTIYKLIGIILGS